MPYPIVLVLGGLALGGIPGLPDVALDPDLVLVLFLPPLLYSSAFFVSLRDLKADLRPISMLAIGLVIATMVAVAVVAHALIEGMPWAAAFALGAIVAPTDALAAGVIARRLSVPRRVMTVLEGESLINDGTALVAYRFAVAAVVSGSFSLAEVGPRFLLTVAGGIGVGLVVGWLVAALRYRLDDPQVEITISLATGYAAYLPAEALDVSGVLAAVTAGIYVGWQAPRIASPAQRMQGYAVWESLTFLLNAILFVLIGLPLQRVVEGLRRPGRDAARLRGRGLGDGDRRAAGLAAHDAVRHPRARPPALAARAPRRLAPAADRRLGGDARRRLARGGARAPAHRRRLAVPAARLIITSPSRSSSPRSCSRASRCRR